MRAVVRRPAVVAATALVVSAFAVGILARRSGRGPVDLPAEAAPATSAKAPCERFERRLPDRLGSLERRDTRPERPGFAAYGDPAVVVRCGVPASARYRSGDQLIAINDVAWYADESRPGGVDFSLPRSIVNISVWIPAAHRAELLSLLTDAVKDAQPL